MGTRGHSGIRWGKRALPAAGILAFILCGAAPAHAACSVTTGDFDGNGTDDLRITGDSLRQILVMDIGAAGIHVQLDCNGDGDFTDAGDTDTTFNLGLETLAIDLKGKDVITVLQSAPAAGQRRDFVLTLGPAGNTVTFLGLAGAPASAQTSWIVDIAGGSGQDDVNISLGSSWNDSLLQVRGDLGAGDDHVTIGGVPTSTNGVIDVDLVLGNGNNSFKFAGGTAGSAYTGFRWNLSAEGSNLPTNVDTVTVDMERRRLSNDSRFTLNANLLAGNDVFTATEPNTFASGGGQPEYRVHVKGGLGNDLLQVGPQYAVSQGRTSNDGLVEEVLDGGPGNDVILVESHVEGKGTTRIRLQGGDGNDSVMSSLWAEDAGFGLNNLDPITRGGRGADDVYSSVFEPGTATYQPVGASLLDGGMDPGDACVFFGNGKSDRFACELGS
jgi:hypothetical protein